MSGIPFSTFVNITSATLSPAATFGRLNALCITSNESEKAFEEFNNTPEVIARYGVESSQAKYASTFFGYSSKTARTAQKLTFYNWAGNGTPITITGNKLGELDTIKVNGTFRVKLGEEIKYVGCNLLNIANFTDAATEITKALSGAYQNDNMKVLYNTEENVFTFTSSTKETFEFLQDNADNFDLYSGDLTQQTTNLQKAIDIVEAGKFILNVNRIESTVSAQNTLKLKINNNIEIFSEQVNNVKANPLTNKSKETARQDVNTLKVTSLNIEPKDYTFKGVNLKYTQNAATDLSSLCKLTNEAGAKTKARTDAKSLADVLTEICENNGDYVTIGFDKDGYSAIHAKDDIKSIMQAVNAYALNRYYVVMLFSDTDIENMKKEDADVKLSDVQLLEGLIAIRGNNIDTIAFLQAIIASIDYASANGAMNINFIDAGKFTEDAIKNTKQLADINKDRINTAYVTGGYGQELTFFGEGHIMGEIFKTLSIALGETYIKAQMEVQGITILNGSNLISLRGKSGQGQLVTSFSSILNNGVISGIIVAGATLTEAEKMLAINAIGIPEVTDQLESVGWFLRIDEITDEHIKNKTIPITFIYVANVPVNRVQARSFLIGA